MFEVIKGVLESQPELGPLVFVVAHTIAAVLLLPCSAFTLLAGTFWPFPINLAISVVGAVVASSTTFFIARRSGLTPRLSPKVQDRFESVIELYRGRGWVLVALANVNPLVPSAQCGYLFGLTSMPFRHYFIANLLGMLPLQFTLVSIGHSARTLWSGSNSYNMIALGGLGILLMVLFVTIGRKTIVKKNGGSIDAE